MDHPEIAKIIDYTRLTTIELLTLLCHVQKDCMNPKNTKLSIELTRQRQNIINEFCFRGKDQESIIRKSKIPLQIMKLSQSILNLDNESHETDTDGNISQIKFANTSSITYFLGTH